MYSINSCENFALKIRGFKKISLRKNISRKFRQKTHRHRHTYINTHKYTSEKKVKGEMYSKVILPIARVYYMSVKAKKNKVF